mgnify:CR=1 FL=1
MKAKLLSHDIPEYNLEVEIENEGEIYLVNVHYDNYDGYEVTFTDQIGNKIPKPQWATDLEENSYDSLGYLIETSIPGWFRWVEEVRAQ